MTVHFAGETCQVRWHFYANGRPALLLVDDQGERMAVATINVPDVDLAPDETIIKDYAENAGMLQALVDAGIVAPTGRVVPVGFTAAPVVKILS